MVFPVKLKKAASNDAAFFRYRLNPNYVFVFFLLNQFIRSTATGEATNIDE